MPRKFSDFKINCIAQLLEQGIDPPEIANAARCSVAKIYQVQQNLNHFNTSRASKLSVQDHLRKLTREMLDVSILLAIFGG